MRLHLHVLIAFALMAVTAPAFAASKQDHTDCNSDDVDRNIRGCTRIIDDSTESDKVRSIAYVGRALALGDKGDRDHAMLDFNEAIRLDPDNALAYSDRGILWREQQDPDHAIADFTEAIRINPQPRSDMAGPGYVNIYANRGLAWQAKGDIDQALSDYDQAIKLDPNDVDAYTYRAQAHFAKKDYDSAIGDLDQAIQRDPNGPGLHYFRGALLYNRYMSGGGMIEQSDFDGAIADFNDAIRLAPKDTRAYKARAEAWNVDGKRDRAIADLTDAVNLDPSDKSAIAFLKELKPDYEPPVDPLAKILKWTPPWEKQ